MKKKIEMEIECPHCKGAGVYAGVGEGKGTAVICYHCDGTGSYNYSYSYNEFTGRKAKKGIKRVYLDGMGYKLGLGKINFNGCGEIDMNEEGISYQEFLKGKIPEHIKRLGCPMMADQGACHAVNGFVDICNRINGGWINQITKCEHQMYRAECWKRFEKGE